MKAEGDLTYLAVIPGVPCEATTRVIVDCIDTRSTVCTCVISAVVNIFAGKEFKKQTIKRRQKGMIYQSVRMETVSVESELEI